jgi:hypothetical protein
LRICFILIIRIKWGILDQTIQAELVVKEDKPLVPEVVEEEVGLGVRLQAETVEMAASYGEVKAENTSTLQACFHGVEQTLLAYFIINHFIII